MVKARERLTRAGAISGLCLALAAGLSGPARALELCPDMGPLIAQARAGFPAWEAAATGAPPPLAGAEDCAVTRSLAGSKAYHCAWGFAYRDAGAAAAFEAIDRSLQACFGERARMSGDDRVNHPDSYDLRRYRLGEVEVALSLKDKSALSRTYIFVRVQAGAAPEP